MIEYLVFMITWGIASWVWYYLILFHTLGRLNLSYNQSIVMLLFLLLTSCIISIYTTKKDDRTGWNIAWTLALPYGFYSMLTYVDYCPKLFCRAGLLAAIATLIRVIFIFIRKYPARKIRKYILKNRIYKAANIMRRNFGIASIVVMLVISEQYIQKGSLLNTDLPVDTIYGEQYNLANNIEEISKLHPDQWEKLNLQEKVDVLETVMYCEANSLGIPHPLELKVDNMGEYTLGSYDDDKKVIRLDRQHISQDSSKEILNSLCHEVYHCAQHRMVDLYQELEPQQRKLFVFRKADAYLENMTHYISPGEDLEGYYKQQMERDARKYGDDSAEEYLWMINYYLKNGEL